MSEKFCRKDIYRLSEHFDFNGNMVWESMRKGLSIIIGKKYLFVRYRDDLDIGVNSYENDFGYGIIEILNIVTGHKEKYKYAFYQVHGDYNDNFNVSVGNALMMYEFRTGKSAATAIKEISLPSLLK